MHLDGGEANALETEIGNVNPFRYRGYYYETESGLYYLMSRYYDPTVSQFLSPDTADYLAPDTIGGVDLYAYCRNNPVMYLDPTGHFWFELATTLVGLVVGAVGGAIDYLTSPEAMRNFSWSNLWKSTVSDAIGGGVTGLVLGVSKGKAIKIASYGAAAADSLVEEIWEYIFEGVELNFENIMRSLGEVTYDVIYDGTWNAIANTIAANIPSIKTNPGWFRPQGIRSYFTKTYGQRMTLQTLVATTLITIRNIRYNIWDWIQEFIEWING